MPLSGHRRKEGLDAKREGRKRPVGRPDGRPGSGGRPDLRAGHQPQGQAAAPGQDLPDSADCTGRAGARQELGDAIQE
jgi:hypothetical protein